MAKVGDRVAGAILGIMCAGTFVALYLTSVAKKANLTGPPPRESRPAVAADLQKHLEEQLKRMERGR